MGHHFFCILDNLVQVVEDAGGCRGPRRFPIKPHSIEKENLLESLFLVVTHLYPERVSVEERMPGRLA